MVLTLLLCWWCCGGGDCGVGASKLYQSKVHTVVFKKMCNTFSFLPSCFNPQVPRAVDAALRVRPSSPRRRVPRAHGRLPPPALGRRQAARLQVVAPRLRLARTADAERVPAAHPEGRVPPARARDIHVQVTQHSFVTSGFHQCSTQGGLSYSWTHLTE